MSLPPNSQSLGRKGSPVEQAQCPAGEGTRGSHLRTRSGSRPALGPYLRVNRLCLNHHSYPGPQRIHSGHKKDLCPRRIILETLRVDDVVARSHLIKVGNDLVEEPQALDPHIVAVQLDVEVIEVGDGGEHDAHLGVGLVIEVLQRQKGVSPAMLCHVGSASGNST